MLQEYARRVKQDHFLRLRFGDEDDSLFVDAALKAYDDDHPQSSLLGRIRRALKHGVRIGGRVFKFLACASSRSSRPFALSRRVADHSLTPPIPQSVSLLVMSSRHVERLAGRP